MVLHQPVSTQLSRENRSRTYLEQNRSHKTAKGTAAKTEVRSCCCCGQSMGLIWDFPSGKCTPSVQTFCGEWENYDEADDSLG